MYFNAFDHRRITIPLVKEKIVISTNLTIAPAAAVPVISTDGGKYA